MNQLKIMSVMSNCNARVNIDFLLFGQVNNFIVFIINFYYWSKGL
jgi:hypothetical protein